MIINEKTYFWIWQTKSKWIWNSFSSRVESRI